MVHFSAQTCTRKVHRFSTERNKYMAIVVSVNTLLSKQQILLHYCVDFSVRLLHICTQITVGNVAIETLPAHKRMAIAGLIF